MGVGRATLVVVCLALGTVLGPALEIHSAQAQGKVDWSRGLLIAKGAASGDLRSPNREMARIKAERQARKRCQATLLEQATQIAKAGGGDFQHTSEALRDSLMLTLRTDFGTDGSVVVTMAFPVDRMRAAAFAPDNIVTDDMATASAVAKPIVIDARKLALKPAVGYLLSDGKESYRGPTLFFRKLKDAQASLRLGDVVTLQANSLKAGTLTIPPNTLKSVGGLPLVVILWSEGKS